MTTTSIMHPLRLTLLIASLLLSHHLPAQVIWNGSVDDSWNNPANWSTSALPDTLDTILFNSSATNDLTTLGSDQTIAGIIFNNTTPLTIGSAEAFNLTISHLTSPAISLSGSNAVTLLSNLILSGSDTQIWENNSSNTFTTSGNLELRTNLSLQGTANSSYIIGSAGNTLTNYGANRTLYVTDTGAATDLIIDSNIVLSEHATTARTLSLNLASNTATTINGDIINGSTINSNLRLIGPGEITFNGHINHNGFLSFEDGTQATINGVVTSGDFRLLSGNVTFNGTSATIRGLSIGSTNSTPSDVSINFASDFTLNLTGDIYLNNTTSPFTLDAATIDIGASRIFDISNDNTLTITSNLTGSGRLHKANRGTLILKGSATYNGANNALTEGTLILDFSDNTDNKLSNQDLNIYTSKLILRGNASSDVTQNMKNLSIASSANYSTSVNEVILEPENGQKITLALQNVTRASSAYGTVRFIIPDNASVTTTTPDNHLHSSWATINTGSGDDHFIGIQSGEFVTATSSISNDDLARAWAPTLVNTNVTDNAGYTGSSDQMNINSLRFSSAAPLNVAHHLNIASGGILITESSTATGIFGGSISAGNSTSEFVFHQQSSTTFEISSNLRKFHDQTNQGINLIKSGSGELILSGQNRTSALNARFGSSGHAYIIQGTLTLDGGNALGDNTAITFSSLDAPTTLKLLASETVGGITSVRLSGIPNLTHIDVGSHTLTINQHTNAVFAGSISGSGNIVKNNLNPLSPTSWELNGTNNDSFTGNLIVNGGQVILFGSGTRNLNAINSLTINQGGGLLMDNNGAIGGEGTNYTSASRINDSAIVNLNGANARNSNGSISGFAIRSNINNVHGELISELNVNSGANYVVIEANATGPALNNNAVLIRATDAINRNQKATLSVIGSNLAGGSNTRARLQMVANNSSAASAAFANQFRSGGAYANGSTALATVNSQETNTGVSLSIVPWAIGQNITGLATDSTLGNSFVHVESDIQGFRALRLDNEYTDYATVSAASSGNNVRESSTSDIDLTSTGGKTVNSLLINNQNNSTTPITVTGSDTLTNTSGAFLFTSVGTVSANGTANANTTQGGITLNGFDGIEVSGPHKEYIVFVTNTATSGVTIESAFTTTDSALTKSGTGLLKLTADNSALEHVTINEGILEISNRNNLGGNTGTLTLAGGTLQLAKDWKAAEADLSGYSIAALDGTISRINTNGDVGSTPGDDTDARLTLGPLAEGNGTIIKQGNGRLTLTGLYDTLHTGDFYVENSGNPGGVANGNIAQLYLQNEGGNSIGGNLYIGSPDADAAQGGAVVFHAASDQIADHAVVTLYGNANGATNRAYWHLRGHSDTIAGLVDTAGLGVVQNGSGGFSTLTVSGSGDYLYAGYLRNQSGTLAFNKDGTGTQTLRGGQITYTGGTAIYNGRLALSNTTGFASDITNDAELEMEQTSSTWTMSKVISGGGTLYKTGNGILRLNAANTYYGITNIDAGTLALTANGSIDSSSSINIKHGATFDVSSKTSGYSYSHHLSGNGNITGDLTITSGGSIRPGASATPKTAASTGDLLGALTFQNNFTLNGGQAHLQIAAPTFNDIGLLSAYAADPSTFTSYLHTHEDDWNSLLHHDDHGVPHHDYIEINGDFTWNSGSTMTYTGLNYTPTAGDILNLWEWASITGDYNLGIDANNQRSGGLLGDLELPDIGGLIYDLTLFQSHGIIVVVPEPSRALLLLSALIPLILRRRR